MGQEQQDTKRKSEGAEGAPSPEPTQPAGEGRGQASSAHGSSSVAIILAACALIAVIVGFSVYMMRGTSSSMSSRQQVESQLDYLTGTSAVTAYRSLNGYPVTFVMTDDGNAIGTWRASDDDGETGGSAGSDAADASGSGGADASLARVNTQVDVTYQVQEAANNDYPLDDDRYTVVGHASPDEVTGQITVIVEERFRELERTLSRTLDIDHVAQALASYGAAQLGDTFDLRSVSATSIEQDTGTWVVSGSARATMDGQDQDVSFSAKVAGTNDNPQVTEFNVIR